MKITAVLLCIFVTLTVWAQDFGFDDEGNTASSSKISVKAGGEAGIDISPYVYDLAEGDFGEAFSVRDFFYGKVNFTISNAYVELYTAFNLNYASFNELFNDRSKLSDPSHTPLIIDEAFIRSFIGPVNITFGMRKLAWGRADSPGPLDVTNPIDYTDLRYITDIKARKIARPMIHVNWNTGDFSKLEGVYIINFAGHRFMQEGRWAPSQFANMIDTVQRGFTASAVDRFGTMQNPMLMHGVSENLMSHFAGASLELPYTGSFDYFQAGIRYTTTIGSVDLGGQYFYGHLFRPAFTVAGIDEFFNDLLLRNFLRNPNNPYYGNPGLISPVVKYNRYHQIGADYAQVLFGLNIRAEFAVFITNDRQGDDGSVQNPFIGWSLGFDRDILWGINLNVQCNETIRLFNSNIGDNPILDSEAGTNASETRLSVQLSKKFLRDNLESKAIFIWDIENSDCYIIPSLIWTKNNFSAELSAGIFAGNEKGELGQYRKNSFIRLGAKYIF